MSVLLRRLFTITLVGFVVLGPGLPLASAQVGPVDPNFRLPGVLPGAANPLVNPALNPAGVGSIINPVTNPSLFAPANPWAYPGWNPYMPYWDPYSGILRGTADVINASGQYQQQVQSARILNEQVFSAQIDNRRRLIELIRWERATTPTPEDMRVREMEAYLSRSRRNPPMVEILNGDSLNALYNNMAKQQGAGLKGPRVDLDEDTLKRINVAPPLSNGNIGLLKDGGTLQWPLVLQRPEFADAQKALNNLLPEAVQQVKFNNPVRGGVLNDIRTQIQSMNDSLVKNINDLTPGQYIEAKRYLNQLNDAYKALQDPNAPNYFNQKWSARGKTVAELIKNMTDAGLKFAPASPGDETAYRALYFALISYDDGLSQVSRNGQ
jgi:hypothetical protein